MKKILILLAVICCCGCKGVSYRENDTFIIKSVSLWGIKYRYEYTVYHIANNRVIHETILYSNEKYELNDTLRLMK